MFKSKSRFSIFALLIILVSLFWLSSAQAAVPVVVFGEYLNYVEWIGEKETQNTDYGDTFGVDDVSVVHVTEYIGHDVNDDELPDLLRQWDDKVGVEDVDLIHDIDDDPLQGGDPSVGDIESYIYGYYNPESLEATGRYNEFSGDASVTKTQKQEGTFEELSDLMFEIEKSINIRICELSPSLQSANCEKIVSSISFGCKVNFSDVCGTIVVGLGNACPDCPGKCLEDCGSDTNNCAKACGERCKEAEDELSRRRTEICKANDDFSASIALDVHLVKDTTALIEDLKNIAREELGRIQFGQISERLQEEYKTAGHIQNFDDFLNYKPFEAASDYLDNYFFNVEESEQSLEQAELDAIKKAVKYSLEEPFREATQIPLKPIKNGNYTVTLDNVFNTAEHGGWDQWIQALEPNHNAYGVMLSARGAAQAVAAAKANENTIQAIAGQGVLPLVMKNPNDSGEKDYTGNPKLYITKPAILVKEDQAAISNQLLNLAGSPEYAPAEKAVGVPGEVLAPPHLDYYTGDDSIANVDWYDDIVEEMQVSVLEFLCACLEDISDLPVLGEVYEVVCGDGFNWDEFNFDFPSLDLDVCGYALCDYVDIPLLCGL